jgi:hypothetical protein
MSPRPGRIGRRIARPAVRASVRRHARRVRRRIWRRTRRLIFGTYALLLIGGTYSVVKLRNQEIDRIEQETNKNVEDLTEEELKAAMKRLGIQKLELTPEDDAKIDNLDEDQSDSVKYCSYCGAEVDFKANFCKECGKKI